MGGRESLAQAFTLLSFLSAGLIGVTSLPIWDQAKETSPSQPQIASESPEAVVPMRASILSLPVVESLQMEMLQSSPMSSEEVAAEELDSVPYLETTASLETASDQRSQAQPSLRPDGPSAYIRTNARTNAVAEDLAAASQAAPQVTMPRSDRSERPTFDVSTPAQQRETSPSRMSQPPFARVERSSLATETTSSMPVATNRQIIVDLSDRQVALYRDSQLQMIFPIAIGRAGWETPVGEFEVIEKQVNPTWQNPLTDEIVEPGPSNPLGIRWISFWSDGKNQLGFHGTNQTELIGQAVSHGCIRMRNEDIERLYDEIALGTPVTIQP